MNFDYSKLKGRIKEIFGNQDAFGEALGLKKSAISNRLNSKTEFTTDEIYRAMGLLKLSMSDVTLYFFRPCGSNN